MPRTRRQCPGGVAYHAMNRCVVGAKLFEDDADYAAFERVLAEGCRRFPGVRLCAYCLMPNHFHLVLWPREDGALSGYMQWVTMTHTQRWHAHRHSAGRGHLYQGRFKSFPVQQDEHFVAVCRYVERNALRARLCKRAEDWRWGSLWRRVNGGEVGGAEVVRAKVGSGAGPEGPGLEGGGDGLVLSDWPVTMPGLRKWVERVNRPERESELEALMRSVVRGQPFGSETWVKRMAKGMDLGSTLRPRGRPRKVGPKSG